MELMEKKSNTEAFPKGYKQTEVGVIPEEWAVQSFKEIFKVNQGLQIAIEQRGKHPRAGSKVYITIQYLNDGKKVEYINDYSASVCCTEDDILMTRTGNTGMVITNVNGVFHNNFFKIDFNRRVLSKDYIVFFLKQNSTQKKILEKAGTSTIPDLNHDDFYSLKIPLPPTLAEQKAIATALSDVDELISSLDQLIQKKKAIKQGAMQELLTGKTRLPGFEGSERYKQTEVGVIPEDWSLLNLGKSSILKARIGWQGLTTAEYLDNGDFYLITGTDFKDGYIDWDNCVFVEKSRYGQDKNIQISEGDVLVTKDGTIGKVAYINKVPKPTTLNSGVFVIRPIRVAYHPPYFYHVLMSEYFKTFLGKLTAGSTISHLYQKDFVHYDFAVPPSLAEQKAIATVLSDMDTEMEALEQKKAKYQRVKQGMMQELLTGKTRLI